MACLCDFCSAPDAEWRHPARSFIGYAAAWRGRRECR